MALTYTGTGGLFTILGQFFGAFETIGTVRATTVKDQIQQAVDEYKKKTSATLDFDRAVNAAAAAEQSWRSAGDTLAAAIQRDVTGLLVETIKADSDRMGITSLTAALEYLIAAMRTDAVFVAPATVTAAYATVSVTGTGLSAPDIGLFASVKNHLARQTDTCLPEVIQVLCTEGGRQFGATHTLRFRGKRAARNKLGEDWPAGSGIDKNVTPFTSADSLLANSGFEDSTAVGSVQTPDDWIVVTGTVGSSVKLTDWEKRQIAITGSPASGTYYLRFSDPTTALDHYTGALAYNATGDDVQTALRAIVGPTVDMSQITVTTTGTSPNFTHVIEFVGQRQGFMNLAVVNNTTGGTFTQTVITSGSDFSIQGRGLTLVKNASELSSIMQPVTLDADKVYFLGYWATCSATATAGSLRMQVIRSVGGSAITDRAGNSISSTFALSTIGTTRSARGMFFSLPPTSEGSTGSFYVEIGKSVAEPTADVTIDEVVLAEAVELYPGGPYVALLKGYTLPNENDEYTLTVANNLASKWQKYFDAFYDTAGKRLVLPTSGSSQIAEALVA